MEKTFHIDIAGLARELPVVPVNSKLHIAFLNTLGDVELIKTAAKMFFRYLPKGVEIIVAPETGGIVIAHQLSLESGLPYIIIRKKRKPHMGKAITTTVESIGTEGAQTLFLGEREASMIRHKRIIVVDEVVSTGSTLRAMEKIIFEAGGEVVAKFAIATEGDRQPEVLSLCHLPLFEKI